MIVLCAGGTGGHVFPAESLAEVLKARGHSLGLITDSRAMNFVNYEFFDKILVLNVDRSNKAVYACSLVKSALKALGFMFSNNVKLAVGFGGYPSLPGMLAAQILRKKTVLHEQNAALGRANKLLSHLSDRVITSFKNTEGVASNAFWIGNPVRGLALKAMKRPKNRGDEINLSIVGGSQGASLFSKVVPKAIANLPESLRTRLRITQQCRPEDIDSVNEVYSDLKVSFHTETFFSDLPALMRNSDLVISRAGASTIAELTCLGVPAILVPLAISKDDDQGKNARYVAANGGASIILEKDFTPRALAAKLTTLFENTETLATMALSMASLGKPEAAVKMADLVERLIK